MVSIVLLNFLVAILADIYTILQLQAKGLHSRQILLMRSGYDDDPYYSSLVLLPVPLNIFMIPFIPFIILFKSKKLNQALIYLCYFPVLVLSMLTFTVGNLIFMPIAYFITILKICMKGIKTQFDIKSLIYVAAELVLFIFFGLFYFLFTISLDVLRFLVSLFEKDKNMPKNSKVIKEIAQLDYNFLKVLIEVLSSYDSQEVETKKIINMLQKKLKIIEQIIEILYKRPTKRKINDESNLDIENTKNISIADPDASSIKINVNIPQKSLKNLDNLQIRCENAIRNKEPEYILKQFNALKTFIIDNSILCTLNSEAPISLITQNLSNKVKSKLTSPATSIERIDRSAKNFKLNINGKQYDSIPLSKTVRKIIMPQALLRILKDIECQAIFRDIIHNTKEWKQTVSRNSQTDVVQKVNPDSINTSRITESEYTQRCNKLKTTENLNLISIRKRIKLVPKISSSYRALYEFKKQKS